jgi:pimeloyl-ACP methyl ester carboxylesterase/predicted glycosyltransferase
MLVGAASVAGLATGLQPGLGTVVPDQPPGGTVRAREPRKSGYVAPTGVRLAYEVYGEGPDSIVFAPADTIVDSRMWKAQVAYLSRHHQVVVIDGLGNGRSDRSLTPEHYADLAQVENVLAVMDECGIDRALVAGLCESSWFALLTAAQRPDRVTGVVAVAPGAVDGSPRFDRGVDIASNWGADLEDPHGWELFNEGVWRRNWPAFPRFFFGEICNDPHSSKVYEDVVEWADQTTGDVMVATAGAESLGSSATSVAEQLSRIRCPVLVIHGTHDLCQSLARGVHIARMTGAELLVLGSASHLPQARHPVVVNHAIDDFARRVCARTATRHEDPIPIRIVPSWLKETQMKAREPDATGFVERDGVRVAWQVYGEQHRPDDPAVLLLPTWNILPAEVWKFQVPYLARRTRVITFDPRGNGASDRPEEVDAYARAQFTQDALDVLDATGTESAVVVALSMGNLHALDLAADHPERVAAWVAIGPAIGGLATFPEDRQQNFDRWAEDTGSDEGWGRYNKFSWLRDYPGFVDFFFDQVVPEEHSTKLIEDLVGWAHRTDAETLVRTEQAESAGSRPVLELCAAVRCPVVVVHGTEDHVIPYEIGRRLAELTGGALVTFEGTGHAPQGREPVALNRVLDDTWSGVTVPRPTPRRERSLGRPKRALYLSSPIGLGHVRRDLAIADELRKLHPDLEIEWLSQSPVTEFLERAGEHVHPASAWLASESGHVESEAGEHDLHAFQAIRRMDEILVANFMVFDDLVRERDYDLWIGDEAWDLDHFLHENPGLKRAPFAWMTDFVGWVPMADGGDHEEFLTSDYNAEMVEHVARYPRLRDRSVFVGDPEDLVDRPLGPDLPSIRDWTLEHFAFAGYVMGDRPDAADRARLRRSLGYGEDELVCIASVGGSGVGAPLLRRIIDSYDAARARVPGLRMHVVTGPRLDPADFAAPTGVDVHGFLPDLDLHHAVCDVAIVQGGLSTTMELTANQRPFLYFPLRHHFEQQVHVRHRLERHGAGRAMDYATADPDVIADALVEELGRDLDYVPVPSDGAARAAALLGELL